MHAEVTVGVSLLLGFLLTLIRISGIFVFVPIPGASAVLAPARIVLALGLTMALFSRWPQVAADASIGQFAVWAFAEAGIGVGIGLAVAFITEVFTMAAQIMGLQAGYSYASTIDPVTQADSTALQVLAQIIAGLLFFATGLHRDIIRAFARSLETYPAGSFVLSRSAAEKLLSAGSMMFTTGLRVALPIVATLIMIDISLALLGRINAQLQLLTIAFPAKALVCLAALGWVAMLFPPIFHATAGAALRQAETLLAR